MTATYRRQQGSKVYNFKSLADLMAKATPERSGDALAGVCAQSAAERVVAQMALSELPLKTFLNEAVIPYESDDITRLIIDTHDLEAFKPIEHLTVGDFRNWLLSEEADDETLAKIEALEIYRWFLPLLRLDTIPTLVQCIKLAEQVCGRGSEQVRAPRQLLQGEEAISSTNNSRVV